MNVCGIITEYNPLHSGHVYHINKTKELTKCDALVCVTSGNFVQRGIPSIIDKWTRAKMALQNGVDLVIELPCLYSLSSAEFFAYGAVSILNSSGIINSICFGSELGDINLLNSIAKVLIEEPDNYKEKLKHNLDLGDAFPAARNKALLSYFPNLNNTLELSNNILSIEYCKSLIKLNSNIIPYTIRRIGSHYNATEISDTYSSATALRKYIKDFKQIDKIQKYIPANSIKEYKSLFENNYPFAFEDSMFSYIKYKIITNPESLLRIPDISEGLENRFYKSALKSDNLEQLIYNIKTKRYTYTRILRILCQLFIGFEKFNTGDLRKISCPYIRVLGFNEMGIKVLKEMKQKSSIPIYTKLPKNIEEVLSLDLQSTIAYSLLNKNISYNQDYLTSPTHIII